MAVAPKANASSTFEIKSAALTLVAVAIKTADLARLGQGLTSRFSGSGTPFDQEPVAIDVTALREADDRVDFSALMALLRTHGMVPIAVRGGSPAQMDAASAAGLAEAHPHAPGVPAVRAEAVVVPAVATPAVAAPAVATATATTTAPAAAAPATPPAPAAAAALAPPTPPAPPRRHAVVVDKQLRSGQQVYAKDADLIVLAVVSFGAEVIADGNIHVYAPLRGRALAGAHGDTSARIFTTCLEPQLVSIAGIYRTTEKELPADVLGKPAQVWLDGDSLVIEPLTH